MDFVNSAILFTIFISVVILLLTHILKLFRNQEETVIVEENQIVAKKEAQTKKKKHWSPREKNFSSPWLLKTLKNHTGQVLNIDYSSSGKYLASCGEDRAVILWDSRDLTQKDIKSVRINIEFDHPTFVKWSPDSRAFVIHKHHENVIEVYKIEKKKDGGWLGNPSIALTFPKSHVTDVIGMGIASNGKFIMSCSNKTDLVVWDLKGQKLAEVDTYLMNTTCAKISPCGRFIVASGFAPEAHVYEVIFNKTGDFKEIKRVFDLTGHSSGIHDVTFDADASHMATISKDGTWKLFDTKIEYGKGESPHLKISGKYQPTSSDPLIALSPNAEVVVIATDNTLTFYSTLSGKQDHVIDDVFTGKITSILFDAIGKFVLVSGDKYIRVFHNVTGYRTAVISAKEKLKEHQTSATKERLEKLIKENGDFLKKF